MLNTAQDFALKLTPLKQAKEMCPPWNSNVPPRIVPDAGRGLVRVSIKRPLTSLKAGCQ